MRLLVLAALLASAAEQDAAAIQRRLQEVLAQKHPDLPAERRDELSARFARGVVAAKDQGHDPARVLEALEWKLQQGTGLVEKVRANARALGSGLDKWVPDAPARLIPPESMLTRERDANLAGVEAYLEEGPSRPAASEQDKQALRAQFERVGEEIRSVARSRITGPYRDAVVEKAVRAVLQDQLGSDLGNPIVGAVVRPLSAAELEALLRSIREEGARSAPIDASSKVDEEYGKTGELVANDETPAVEFAIAMANRLYRFGELNYPRTTKALDDRDAVVADAMAWVKKEWEPIAKELDRQRVAFKKPSSFDSKPARPKPPPLDVRNTTEPPPSPRAPAPRDAGPSPLARWSAGLLLLLVGAAAIAAFLLLRRKKR